MSLAIKPVQNKFQWLLCWVQKLHMVQKIYNIAQYHIWFIKSIIGIKGKLLTENLEVSVSFYNEKPISIELPNQVHCKIKSTDVALKGQTVSSSYKPAMLNNGLNIQVPPFIEAGDEIVLDTRNLEYIKKI